MCVGGGALDDGRLLLCFLMSSTRRRGGESRWQSEGSRTILLGNIALSGMETRSWPKPLLF